MGSVSALAVGEVIGEGGMGVVRSAVQRSLGRTVAIKTSLPGSSVADAQRVLQEAWVTGFLEHPGVVPIHDILRDEHGAPVVVMRRIRGATWDRQRVDVAWASAHGARDLLEQNLRVFARVCEIVEFAHASGVMHRDVKPANVMLGAYGEVYLLDWGLALALNDETAARLPRAGMAKELAGTLAYASPEMVGAIDAPLGEHTDVYLLGASLFELATGRPPHDRATVTLTLESIAASPPVLPSRVPARLAAICARATAKEPAARYPGVAQLRLEVLDFLRHRDSEDVVAEAARVLESLSDACREGASRRRIYDLYGECRFAFREALRMWPGNEAARSGLTDAATLVIERELARDPRVAVALLDEAPDVAPELSARVRASAAAETSERERMSRVALVHDRDTGARARRIYFVFLGLGWAASQFAGVVGPNTHRRFALLSLLELVLLPLAYVLSRDMMRTLFNRRLLGAVAVMLVSQSILFFVTEALGIDLVAARCLQLGLWTLIVTCIATFLERRFWPTVVVMGAGLVITVRVPQARAVVGAVVSLAVTLNMALIWRRPRQLHDRAPGSRT